MARKKIEGTVCLMDNGMVRIKQEAMFTLDWKAGETECIQLIDFKSQELYILEKGSEAPQWLLPLLGQKFTITKNKYVTLSTAGRRELGWKIGDKFNQSLDSKIKGIIITKAVEEQESGESNN